MKGLRPVAIVVGALVAVAGTVIVGAGYFVASLAIGLVKSFSSGNMQGFSTADFVVVTLIMILFVTAGGYVAGRLGRTRLVAHGVAVGATIFGLGFLMAVPEAVTSGMNWYAMLTQSAVVPAGAAGGYLARWPVRG
jgi:hypothetical protein